MIMVNEKKKKVVRKRKPVNNYRTKLPLVVGGAVFLIIFLIVYYSINNQDKEYKKIKQYKNNYLVYTKYENSTGKYPVNVPFVNIDSDPVKAVNKDIDLFVNDFVKSKKSVVSYEYSISGIILSVVVKVVDYDTDYAPMPYFRSYNINLSTLEVIADQSLLNFFSIDEDTVEVLIEDQFRHYYDDIVSEGYYEGEECNYRCFLNCRGFDEYLDNIVYYVDEGNLTVFKPFTFNSVFGEQDYFKDEDFKILLVKGKSE